MCERLRLLAAEPSIHASGIFAVTAADRAAHAETSKKKILGARY